VTHQKAYGQFYICRVPSDWDQLTLATARQLGQVSLLVADNNETAHACNRHLGNEVETRSDLDDLARVELCLARLAKGQDIAWLDTGPDLSEPGQALLGKVTTAGFPVVPLMGAAPSWTLLQLFPFHESRTRVLRLGSAFNKGHRAALNAYRGSPEPLLVSLEARHLATFLTYCRETLSDRKAVLLTAVDGLLQRGSLSELASLTVPATRDGATLLLEGLTAESSHEVTALIDELAERGLASSELARELASRLEIPKAHAYRLVLGHDSGATQTQSEEKQVIRFTIKGHPDLRGTHAKTLEFKRGESLSQRETCVIGIGADWLPETVKRLRGRLLVTISHGETEDRFQAEVCRSYNARDVMVFRKSGKQSQVTLGIHSSKGAADMDRTLIKELADKNATAEVTITTLDSQ